MRILQWLFGSGRNVLAETAHVFRENSEAGAQRRADYAQAALSQYAAEFQHARRGAFDRFMDGLNRLPRPLITVATFALFASAMFDPIWFAERMQGLALVPEPLWWLAGTVVAFFFGGRFQIKQQEFQRSVAGTSAMLPQVLKNISAIRALRSDSPGAADTGTDVGLQQVALGPGDNPAIAEWNRSRA